MVNRRKGKKSFGRKRAERDVYEKILIVCEDSCTAPNYLNAHIRAMKLPQSIQAKATGDSDPTPDKVVEYALNWLNKEKKSEGFGEHKTTVFCVIDRDEHPTFEAALDRLKRAYSPKKCENDKVTVKGFPSYPCFEVWYLLHFKKLRKPFHRVGDLSPAKMVVKELKTIKEFANYEKNSFDHYEILIDRLSTAITNATWSKADAERTGQLNSSTTIQDLIAYLDKIKKKIESQKS